MSCAGTDGAISIARQIAARFSNVTDAADYGRLTAA